MCAKFLVSLIVGLTNGHAYVCTYMHTTHTHTQSQSIAYTIIYTYSFIANRIFTILLLFETIVFGLFIGAVGLGQVSDIILLISTTSDHFGKFLNTFQSSFHCLPGVIP